MAVNDCILLHDEFIILVSHVLVAKLKVFQVFSDVIRDHIPHQYSKEMSEKSHIVSSFLAIVVPVCTILITTGRFPLVCY